MSTSSHVLAPTRPQCHPGPEHFVYNHQQQHERPISPPHVSRSDLFLSQVNRPATRGAAEGLLSPSALPPDSPLRGSFPGGFDQARSARGDIKHAPYLATRHGFAESSLRKGETYVHASIPPCAETKSIVVVSFSFGKGWSKKRNQPSRSVASPAFFRRLTP